LKQEAPLMRPVSTWTFPSIGAMNGGFARIEGGCGGTSIVSVYPWAGVANGAEHGASGCSGEVGLWALRPTPIIFIYCWSCKLVGLSADQNPSTSFIVLNLNFFLLNSSYDGPR
jgi:hypothetical protein